MYDFVSPELILRELTAPFNKMRTPKFKPQPTNAFFATVNQMFDRRTELARLITQDRNIFSNISEATTFLLQDVTENDAYKFKIWEIRYN